jgi:hypothetical protein
VIPFPRQSAVERLAEAALTSRIPQPFVEVARSGGTTRLTIGGVPAVVTVAPSTLAPREVVDVWTRLRAHRTTPGAALPAPVVRVEWELEAVAS